MEGIGTSNQYRVSCSLDQSGPSPKWLLQSLNIDKPIWVSFVLKDDKHILSGETLIDALARLKNYNIDNVLLNPKEEVATTAFFDYLKQNLLTDGNDPDQIANKLHPLWIKVQKKSKCESSDPNLESYLKKFLILPFSLKPEE